MIRTAKLAGNPTTFLRHCPQWSFAEAERTGHRTRMTHYSRLSRIVIDTPGDTHAAEVDFWQAATGLSLQRSQRFPAYHRADLDGGFGILLQRLDDGPARVHLDIHTDNREAEVARLIGLGAQVIGEEEQWTVLRDPAGLVFCVVMDPHLDLATAQRWPD
jgi:hypothetical protein